MLDNFRFETFVDVHSNIFAEYLSSVIAKLPKENPEYRSIEERIEELYKEYPKVMAVLDTEKPSDLSEQECKALIEVLELRNRLSDMQQEAIYFRGCYDSVGYALESMPKQLMEAQTKLETVEHQLETAKVEVTKPFAQEAELAEKLERLSALNALLNMDEKGNDGIDMDDEPEAPKSEKEVADRPAKNIPIAEKAVGTEQDKGIRQYADAPAERVSLKAKLEVMKAKVAGAEKPGKQMDKGKEVTI